MKAHLLRTAVTLIFIFICININAVDLDKTIDIRTGVVVNILMGDNPLPGTHDFQPLMGGILEATYETNKKMFKIIQPEVGFRLQSNSFYLETAAAAPACGVQRTYVTNSYIGYVVRLKVDATKLFHPYVGATAMYLTSQNKSEPTPEIISDYMDGSVLIGLEISDKSRSRFGTSLEYQHSFQGYAIMNNCGNEGMRFGSVIGMFRYGF